MTTHSGSPLHLVEEGQPGMLGLIAAERDPPDARDAVFFVAPGCGQQRTAGHSVAPLLPGDDAVGSDAERFGVQDQEPRPVVGQDAGKDARPVGVEIAGGEDVLVARVAAPSARRPRRAESETAGRMTDLATRETERGSSANRGQDARDLVDGLRVVLDGSGAV
jgi:hypothetical protein